MTNNATFWTEADGSPRIDVANAILKGDDEGVRLLVINAAMAAAELEGGAQQGGLGYSALARRLGRNTSTIYRWSSGAVRPGYETQVVLRLIIWQSGKAPTEHIEESNAMAPTTFPGRFYQYEVECVHVDENGDVERVDSPNQANAFGVYRRPRRGANRLAEHVHDCDSLLSATAMAKTLAGS